MAKPFASAVLVAAMAAATLAALAPASVRLGGNDGGRAAQGVLAAAGSPASWWTLSQAVRFVRNEAFEATDKTQPDNPRFTFEFRPVMKPSVRPVGAAKIIRGRRRWNAFAVSGTAYETAIGDEIAVSFRLRPLGAPANERYSLLEFRGPQPNSTQPSFPIRSAFYYGWYPTYWNESPYRPSARYTPSLGQYFSDDPKVIHGHIHALLYGKFQAGIYSWWGVGAHPDTDRLLSRYLLAARSSPFRWTIYYEKEGYGDPGVDEIHSDLVYIRDHYAKSPAFLRINGRFVVFVYSVAESSCAVTQRWRDANQGVDAYIVMGEWRGAFFGCPTEPDAWHYYVPVRSDFVGPQSYSISPGFNFVGDPAPRLDRDLNRWRQSIRNMISSRAPWQLITTFNEWGEGTAVESAKEWETSSGFGAYLDALHNDGQ